MPSGSKGSSRGQPVARIALAGPPPAVRISLLPMLSLPDPLGPRERSIFAPYEQIDRISGQSTHRYADESPIPRRVTLSWDAFARSLTSQCPVVVHKRDSPVWSPAEYKPHGKRRRNAPDCLHVHDLCLDLDYGTQATQLDVLRRVLADGLTWAMHSTHRHTEENPRTRVIVPLAFPVPANQWPAFYQRVRARYCPGAKLADEKTRDPQRLWYFPSRQSEASPYVVHYHANGTALDPTPYLISEEQGGAPNLPRQPITPYRAAVPADLKDLLSRWKRAKHPHAGTLRAVIAWEAYAVEGHRDTTTFQLTRDIVRECPELTTPSLVALFQPSLQIMGMGDAESLAKLTDQIDRAREDLAAEPQKRGASPVQDEDIIQAMTDVQAATSDELPITTGLPLLVHVDDSGALYLYQKGTYAGPIAKQDRWASICRILAPYVQANVLALHTIEGQRVPVESLILQHGCTVNDVAFTIGALQPEFRHDSGRITLYLPAANRTGTPRYSPNVDAFLRYLCPTPEHLDDLHTWLVVAKTRPFDGLPALALVGEKGTGKSLLGHCLATLWHTQGPVPAKEALGNHAEGLLRCPLVLADEQLPVDERGKVASAHFREAIGAKSYRVNPKGKTPLTVHGAQRWILTANDLASIEFKEDLSRDAILAVNERVYLIDLRDRGLAKIPRELGEIIIAEFFPHVLHLAQTHVLPQSEHRFWIAPRGTTYLDHLRTEGTALRSSVLYWIVTMLRQPSKLRALVGARRSDSTLTREGLAISVRDVYDTWPETVGTARPPAQAISKQLALLSDPERPSNDPQGAIPVEHALISRWAERHRIAHDSELDGATIETGPGAQVIDLFAAVASARMPRP